MDFIGQMVQQNLGDYEGRCESAVSLLAKACSFSPNIEVDRFGRVMEAMGKVPHARGPATEDNPFAALQAKVVEAMPPVVEFVTTHAAGELKGFGYLTEGRPGSDLPSTLMTKLENTFKICLTEGGGVEDAELLADVFRVVFPNVGQLEHHSPLAQAFLMGFVPQGEKLLLKAYFNTRLSGGDHKSTIAGVLERLSLQGGEFYDRLYTSGTDARFVGVGVDLHGDGIRRAKLYVKVPVSQFEKSLQSLLLGQSDIDVAGAVKQSQMLLTAVDCEALASEVELAIGLSSASGPTLKLTAFFSSDDVSAQAEHKVQDYLAQHGYGTHELKDAFRIMGKGIADPGVKKQPVHGIGIEFPVAEQVKINTYFNPLV